MSDFKGVWIPAELWTCKKLKLIEKLFLTQIYSLDSGEGCTAGNAYFSEFFDMTKSRCSQIIKSLEAKEMIKITIERDGKLITKRVKMLLKNMLRSIKNYIKFHHHLQEGPSELRQEGGDPPGGQRDELAPTKPRPELKIKSLLEAYAVMRVCSRIYVFPVPNRLGRGPI